MLVDVTFVQKFDPPVLREDLYDVQGLEDLMLLKKGSRLSIQPLTAREWEVIMNWPAPSIL